MKKEELKTKVITDTTKDIQIKIKDNFSVSIKKIRNPKKLEQLAKCIKDTANDKIVNDKKINNYTFKIYDLLIEYESNKLKTIATNKQQLTYLKKISNELEKFYDLIDIIHSIQDPLEITSDYSHFASSKEISECFFDVTGINKARMLIGIAIGNNKNHTDRIYKYDKDKNEFKDIASNQRGKKDNDTLSDRKSVV